MSPLDRILNGTSIFFNGALLLLGITLKLCGVIFCFGLVAWGLGIISFNSIADALWIILTPVRLLGDLLQWLFGVPTE